jgi:rare lipoprotein A
VVVRINDRGPFAHDRIIDLSYSAAVKLDMVSKGTARVEVRAIDTARPPRRASRPLLAGTSATPADLGGIYLQAGAFSSETNAQLLHSRLRDAVDPVIDIKTHPDPASTLIRVRLGPLESVEEALRLAAKLDRLGVTGARVVVD